MSKLVDERVVQMSFDNSKFDKNVHKSMDTIAELKASLDFKAVEIAAIASISNITDKITDMGLKLAKSLSIDNITSGWAKYESKTKSIGTLLSQGLDKDLIDEQVDYLSWYTDETSYSFDQMFESITKFTAKGIELEEATSALVGVANWAASAGQNSVTASRAMYQLSQAMGSGYIRYQDWQQAAVNTNMATTEIQKILADVAAQIEDGKSTITKIVSDTGEAIYQTADGTQYSLAQLFASDALTNKLWLTKDVFLAAMKEIEGGTRDVYDQWLALDGEMKTSEIMSRMDQTRIKFFKAAQEARSLSDAIGAIKEASGSAWSSVFENIFGEYTESVKLWTALSNRMYTSFVDPIWDMEKIVTDWKEMGGMDTLFAFNEEDANAPTGAMWNLYEAVSSVTSIFKNSFNSVFGVTSERLYEITKAFQDFTKNLILNEETSSALVNIVTKMFTVLKSIADVIIQLGKKFKPLIETSTELIEKLIIKFSSFLDYLNETFANSTLIDSIGTTLSTLIESLNNLFTKFTQNKMVIEGFDLLNSTIKDTVNLILKLINSVESLFDEFNQNGKFITDGFVNGVSSGMGDVINIISNLAKGILNIFASILQIHSPSKATEEMGKFTVQGFINGIVNTTKDLFSVVAVTFNKFLDVTKNIFEKVFTKISNFVLIAYDKLTTFFKFIKTNLFGLWDKAIERLETTKKTVYNFLKTIFESAKTAKFLDNLVNVFKNIFISFRNIIERIIKSISKALEPFASENEKKNPIYSIANSLSVILDAIINIVTTFISVFANVMKTLSDLLKQNTESENSALYNFLSSIGKLFESILKLLLALVPLITRVIDIIVEKINSMAKDPENSFIIQAAKKFFTLISEALEIVILIFDRLYDVIFAALGSIKKLFTKTAKEVGSVNEVTNNVSDVIKETEENIGDVANNIIDATGNVDNVMSSATDAVETVTKNVSGIFGPLLEAVKKVFTDIDIDKTSKLLRAFGVILLVTLGTTLLTWISPLGIIFRAVRSLSWVMSSISGIIDAVAVYVWVSTIKVLCSAIMDIVKIVLALSIINIEQVKTSLGIIIGIFTALIAFLGILVHLSKVMSKSLLKAGLKITELRANILAFSKVMTGLTSSMLVLSASLLLVVTAIESLSLHIALVGNKWIAATVAIVVLGVALTAFMFILNKFAKEVTILATQHETIPLASISKLFINMTLALLILAGAIRVLASAIKVISNTINQNGDWSVLASLFIVILFYGGLMGAMAIFSKITNAWVKGHERSIILEDTIKNVSEMIIAFGLQMLMLSTAILVLGVSLNIITKTIDKFVFGKFVLSLLVVGALLTGIVYITVTLYKKCAEVKKEGTKSKTITETAKTINTIAFALTKLVFVVSLLALDISLVAKLLKNTKSEDIWRTFGLIAAILVMLAVFLALLFAASLILNAFKPDNLKNLDKILKTVGTLLLKLSATLLILTTTLVLFSSATDMLGISPETLIKNLGVVGLILIGLAAFVALLFTSLLILNKTKPEVIKNIEKTLNGISKLLLNVSMTIGILVVTLTVMSILVDNVKLSTIITSGAILVAIIASLSLFIFAISKLNAKNFKVGKILGLFYGIVPVLIALVSIVSLFSLLSQKTSFGALVASGVIITVIMSSLVLLAALSPELAQAGKNMEKASKGFSAFGKALTKILAPIVIAISVLTIVIGGIMALLKYMDILNKQSKSIAGISGGPQGALNSANKNMLSQTNPIEEAVVGDENKTQSIIVSKILNIFRAIRDTIIGAKDLLVDIITTLLSLVIEILEQAIPELFDFVQFVLRQLIENVVKTLRIILDYAPEIFSILSELISTVFNYLLEDIGNGTRIYNFGKNLASIARDFLFGIIDGLFPYLGSITDKLIDFVTELLDKIGSSFLNKSGKLGAALAKFLVRVIAGILNALIMMRATLMNMFYRAIGALFEGGGKIGNWISEKFYEAADEVIAKSAGAVDKVTKVINDGVAEVDKQLEKQFNSIGEDTVDGYIDGVESKSNEVNKTMIKLGKNATEATQQVLGIHSPSRVFREIGQYIDEGLVLGVEDELDDISKVLVKVSEMVSTSIDDDALTIRPVMDLSDVQNGTYELQDMLNNVDGSIYSSSKLARYTNKEIKTNKQMATSYASSDDISSLANTISQNQNGNSINNVFNITGSNAKEIANEVNDILQKQLIKGRAVYGN